MRLVTVTASDITTPGRVFTEPEEKAQGVKGTLELTDVLVFEGVKPENHVYTDGIKFPIDVVSLDATGRVIGITTLKPNSPRLSPPRGTVTIIEVAAGAAEDLGFHFNAIVDIEDQPAD